MSDERIDIEIVDKIAPSVQQKIKAISDSAVTAHSNVEKLKGSLQGVGAGRLSELTNAVNKQTQALDKQANTQHRLNQQYLAGERALNQAIAAEQRAAEATNRAAAAKTAAEVATRKLATADQHLATAQQQTATAAQKLTTATNNAQAAAQRLAAAVTNAQTATQRLATAMVQTQTAAQRLTTEQNRTAKAALQVQINQQKLATAATQTATATQRLAISTANASKAHTQAATAVIRHQQAVLALAQAQRQAKAPDGSGAAVAGLVGGALGANAILQQVNAYQALENKIRTLTGSEQEREAVQKRLLEVSNRTYTDVSATTQMYQRMSVASNALGLDSGKLWEVIENLNKAVAVSGSSSVEASSALFQLSQAFGANRLSGQELNSVLEQLPIVADTIAAQLGLTRAELKGVAKEGQITGKVIFDAFAEGGKGIADLQERFARLNPTIALAATVFKNQWMTAVGTLAEASGAAGLLSNTILFLADNIALVGIASAGVLPILIAGIAQSTIAMGIFNRTVLANPIVLGLAVGAAFIAALVTINEKTGWLNETFARMRQLLDDVIMFALKGIAGWIQMLDAAINKWNEFWGIVDRPKAELSKPITDLIKRLEEAADKGKGASETIVEEFGKATGAVSGTSAAAEELEDWFEKVRSGGWAAGTEGAKAFEQSRKAITDLIEDLKFEQEQIKRSAVEQEVHNALRRAGADATQEQRQQIESLVRSIHSQKAAQDALTSSIQRTTSAQLAYNSAAMQQQTITFRGGGSGGGGGGGGSSGGGSSGGGSSGGGGTRYVDPARPGFVGTNPAPAKAYKTDFSQASIAPGIAAIGKGSGQTYNFGPPPSMKGIPYSELQESGINWRISYVGYVPHSVYSYGGPTGEARDTVMRAANEIEPWVTQVRNNYSLSEDQRKALVGFGNTWREDVTKSVNKVLLSGAGIVRNPYNYDASLAMLRKNPWIGGYADDVGIWGDTLGKHFKVDKQPEAGYQGAGTGSVSYSKDIAKNLPAFRNGGSFTVGGRAGVDKNLVEFMASRGEEVTVTPAGAGQEPIVVHQHFHFPNDGPQSFRRSDREIAMNAARGLEKAR